MLKQVAKGVLVHQSKFCQSNAVVVQGRDGILLIDPGITAAEMATIATDLHKLGQTVVAGFSTHPHWDHLLWDAQFGEVPRFGTSGCAAAIKNVLSNEGWQARVGGMLPPEFAAEIPVDEVFGKITALPEAAAQLDWDGPKIRVIEHQAHAPGHAALLIEDAKVLVAGDMLSDVLVPLLNLMGAADPVKDYLAGLQLLDDVAKDVGVLIPGHGSVGDANDVRSRIGQDRAYLMALGNEGVPDDPRLGPAATYDWVLGVHERQAQQLSQRKGQNETTG
jgi:glyoxylase-like metal-dependent hydrolase (beta-lactamase superfamily II)